MLNTVRPVMLKLAERQVDGKATTLYACRKATDEGPIPRVHPEVFEGRVPPGWELVGPDDPWWRRMFG